MPDSQIVILDNINANDLTNNHFTFAQDFDLHNVPLNFYEETLTDGDDYFYTPRDTNGNPVLDTTPQRIYGRGGNDTIFGNLGDDELHEGNGMMRL